MRPHFNSHQYNPNHQLSFNGANASAPPQQVIGSQGYLGPNQMQMQMQIPPQFQVGLLNSPQLAIPPFTNPNAYFAATQFFPFLQGPMQALNTNNMPQIFTPNAVNQPQFMPNGQLNVPNLVQNVNQLLQMQMANCGPQNMGPFTNAQMGLANGNGIVPQLADGIGANHFNQPPQTQGNHISFPPGAAESQSNAKTGNVDYDGNNSWRKSQNKNLIRSHNNDASQGGMFSKNQYQHRHNAQGSFKLNNENGGKGNKNNGVKNLFSTCPAEQKQPGKKRSLVLNYTEQEIRQWREARRKNYPSNANVDKKSKVNPTQPELMDEVAKMRRQQLKEILTKQAELGCEVAEVPSYYLSDSELQTDGRQQNSKEFGKRGNFRGKFDRKSKFHQFDRFSKRQRPENRDSMNMQNQSDLFNKKQRLSNGCMTNHHTDNNTRESSLLKKLLSSDLKRDKTHLLQVFRFMVTNSFFENRPEKYLKLPLVIVNELGDESLEKKPQTVKAEG